jgi:hypothetical protein
MIPPLSYILIPALITFCGAFLGSVCATFITPRLQHRFWKRPRLEEPRFAVVAEANRLAAQFSMGSHGMDSPPVVE